MLYAVVAVLALGFGMLIMAWASAGCVIVQGDAVAFKSGQPCSAKLPRSIATQGSVVSSRPAQETEPTIRELIERGLKESEP